MTLQCPDGQGDVTIISDGSLDCRRSSLLSCGEMLKPNLVRVTAGGRGVPHTSKALSWP